MKKFVVALMITSAMTAPAFAQFYGYQAPRYGGYQPPVTTRPNVFGGYNIQQPGQPDIMTRPNVFGGVNCQ